MICNRSQTNPGAGELELLGRLLNTFEMLDSIFGEYLRPFKTNQEFLRSSDHSRSYILCSIAIEFAFHLKGSLSKGKSSVIFVGEKSEEIFGKPDRT